LRRASILVFTGLALVVAGCGSSSKKSSSAAATSTSASTSTGTTPAASTGGGSTVHLSTVSGKLAFNTTKLTAKAGQVTMVMANPSSFSHGISVEGHGVDKAGKVVGQGSTSTVTVTLKPGTYTFYCPVPGHEAAGMKGTLTVT
jgi:plastocyanin